MNIGQNKSSTQKSQKAGLEDHLHQIDLVVANQFSNLNLASVEIEKQKEDDFQNHKIDEHQGQKLDF